MTKTPPSKKLTETKDRSDETHLEDARSPVTGLTSAIDAGASFWETAQSIFVMRTRRKVKLELPAYLAIQASWFIAFGLQFVLFPYLITTKEVGADGTALGLGLSATWLGLAQLALMGPSVIFLLIGGVVAERMPAKPLLVVLHLAAAIPAFGLFYAVATNSLTYTHMILYGLTLGTVGAFMMPARDAILNEVVHRRVRIGSNVTLQQGVTFATLVQFGAQIAGLVLGGYADKLTQLPSFLGGFSLGPIESWRLFLIQAAIVGGGALIALMLARGRAVNTGRRGMGAAVGDIAEGFAVIRQHPKLLSMTVLMSGVGTFVMGAFMVVLPIVNRDIYGLGSDGLRDMYVTFWLGAFLSSVALSVFKNIKRQGRVLLLSQFLGGLAILPMIYHIPYGFFLTIVFMWGVSGGISMAMSRSIVQKEAPKNQLARVLSIYQLGFMVGAPVGAVIMGGLVDLFGPFLIAIVPAVGMCGLVVCIALFSPIWNLKNIAPKR